MTNHDPLPYRSTYAERYAPGSIPYRACMNGYYDNAPAFKEHVEKMTRKEAKR
jgi:hypothetical protein